MIILYNLALDDLANIADTNKRLKNISASVFCRKYGDRLISFDAFHYQYDIHELWLEILKQDVLKICKRKKIIGVSKANIWFKLLRNFGEFVKFIRIQCAPKESYELKCKLPIALKNLFQYVLQYCTVSLEILELHSYPFFTLNKPLNKHQEFNIRNCFEDIGNGKPKQWNPELLNLMPNIRSLNMNCDPKTLEKHFPKLERVTLSLNSDKESVNSMISFLRLNRQITYLKLIGIKSDNIDLIYSSIEEILTQLKILKIPDGIVRQPSESIPTYRLKTIEKFSFFPLNRDFNKYLFEFNELEKITIHANLHLVWVQFLVLNIKKIKILKISLSGKYWWKYTDCNAIVKELTHLPDLEHIVIKYGNMENILALKTALGSEWKQNEIKEYEFKLKNAQKEFKTNFQRIPKQNKLNV